MDPESETIVITAECLCKAHTFSTRVSKSQLPLESTACHCDSCRHVTGALYVIETTWPQPREDVDLIGLHRYQFSPNITYRFCGTCSTLMFYEPHQYPSKLGTFSGPLRNIDVDIIKLARHIYVKDTIDGGASVWLRRPNADGKEIPRYQERSGEEISWEWPVKPSSAASSTKQAQEAVPLWCRCRGVELLFHPGRYVREDENELPWFIDPPTRKHIANFDVCNPCRLQFANEIVNWAFIDFADITQVDGGPFPKTMEELKAAVDAGDPAIGTLASYQSSPGIQRYFCKVCSASIFFSSSKRPTIIDVPVGILGALDGARAERYLSWTLGDAPTWIDDVKGGWREGFVARVVANAEEFRATKNYPKSWKRLQKEGSIG